MRIRIIPGPELSRAQSGPATCRVVPGDRVATGAGGGDGGFAGLEEGFGDVEDEFEAFRGGGEDG